MSTTVYLIQLSRESNGQIIFDGYFKLNNVTNRIIEMYETINGYTNFYNNILGPDIMPPPNDIYTANYLFYSNTFSFSDDGTNFTSTHLQNQLSKITPYFNIYSVSFDNAGVTVYKNILWQTNDLPVNVYIASTVVPEPSCFNQGTKILSLNKNLEEEYIPIENLKKGDLVKSYKHGYRRIDLFGKNIMINNPSRFNQCMYKMEKTEQNGLIEDLYVTGAHSILVDDLGEHYDLVEKICEGIQKIDDKYLLVSAVSKEFKKLDNTDMYTYYQFTLENNGGEDDRFGVWANGILLETPTRANFLEHEYL